MLIVSVTLWVQWYVNSNLCNQVDKFRIFCVSFNDCAEWILHNREGERKDY